MSTPPPTETHSGVIHDIGYRPYTGPRLGRRYATRSLFEQSLRAAYGLGRSGKSKVLPMLVLAVVTVPALIMVAVGIMTGADKLPLDYAEYLSIFGLFPAIFTAAQAPVLMSRDLRHNTVPLYFSRPITRTDYVGAKFGAMAAALLLLMLSPLLVLYAGALLAKLPFGENTEHLLYGVVAALLYAVLYAGLGLLIAAATPRRGFGVAAIMGVLTVTNILAAIVFNLIGGLGYPPPQSAQWALLLSPGMLVEGFVNQVFDLGAFDRPGRAPGALGAVVFAVETVALVAASYGLLRRRYRNI
ncbi:ABC transporter permease [Kitasatospora camelliae]|uniref:ABC transporter permease n=1 Tax=Kitasatospora camelliae TaxID=3156397 RepID=A0AAU8K0F9_9ACTN